MINMKMKKKKKKKKKNMFIMTTMMEKNKAKMATKKINRSMKKSDDKTMATRSHSVCHQPISFFDGVVSSEMNVRTGSLVIQWNVKFECYDCQQG